MIPSDRATLDQLARDARELIAKIGELSEGSGEQLVRVTKENRATRRMVWGLAGSFVLDVLLTLLLGVGLVGLNDQAKEVDALTHRIDIAQTVQRQKALCPLYKLFIDSESPQGRKAAPDPKKYDHAFIVIRDGYTALDCDRYLS
jgi:hypothetical protein